MNELERGIYNWCLEQRQIKANGLEAFESGRLRMSSNDGMGWRDISQEQIDLLKRHIAELNQIIEEYERRDAQRP